ncbi:MAG: hypothetical protein ACO27F_14255 [Beijerinckiaceae bacterium]
MFLMRSAFWLGLVFVYAPADPGDERREAAARAALFTGAVLQGAAAVMEQMPDDPARLCVKAPSDCAKAAQTAQSLAAASPRPGDKTQANRREPKQETRKPAAGGQSSGGQSSGGQAPSGKASAKATVEQAETRRPQRPRDAQAPAARS